MAPGASCRGVRSVDEQPRSAGSGHEIATAVLPSFITSVLHGSAASLGLIEGVSDALTDVPELVDGPWANDPARRWMVLAEIAAVTTALLSASPTARSAR